MKTQSHSILIVPSSLVLTLAVFIWVPTQAQSTAPAEEKMMMDGKMMEPYQAMPESPQAMTEPQQTLMQHHQAMMADLKAQDTDLAAQIAKMFVADAERPGLPRRIVAGVVCENFR